MKVVFLGDGVKMIYYNLLCTSFNKSYLKYRVQNSTSSYLAKKSRQNRCVLRYDLNVLILPELQMASGSPFQTVGTAEEK